MDTAVFMYATGREHPLQEPSRHLLREAKSGQLDARRSVPNQLPGLIGTYGRQYYVDTPQSAPLVRFIMLDANLDFADGTHSYEPGTARYDWTAAAIDGARAAGVPWVVVGMHKPCFSLGQ